MWLTAAAEQGDWTAGPLLERYVLRVSPLCRETGSTPSRVATALSSGGGRGEIEGQSCTLYMKGTRVNEISQK